MKLDIGCGQHRYEGWTPHDWRLECDARVLPYEDGSIEEIRASHVLEHIPRDDVEETVRHWVRKLKPGGILRIAVPDVQAIFEAAQKDSETDDPSKPPVPWEKWLMGGGVDAYDVHYTAWNHPILAGLMTRCGLVNITEWRNDYPDAPGRTHECSDLPISLNLAGVKPNGIEELPPPKYTDMRAVMTMPRLAWTDNMFVTQGACMKLNVPVVNSIGVFYGQGMQRVLENACSAPDLKYALAIDYDSIFDWKDIVCLRQIMERDGLDALAPMQAGRERNCALFRTIGADGTVVPVTREHLGLDWFPVGSAHFGLTLIRLDALRKLPKPWFKSEPAPDGTWGEGRVDDDIYFWKQAVAANWKIGLAPKVHIGHIETVISWVEPNRGKQYQSMFSWLRGGKPWYVRNIERIWRTPEPSDAQTQA